MPEDIFDIVNAQDKVIGHAPRSIVHRESHLHRAAHIWIFNTEGRLLLQLRTSAKDRHPNTWDSSASGHVDSGEDYLTAAIRETSEELGLAPVPMLKEVGYCADTWATDKEFVRVYRSIHDGPFQPDPKEISDVQWTDPDTLLDWMEKEPKAFAPAFVHLWKLFGKQD